MNPDGIMLSNGPGNPEDNPEIIEEIRKITKAGKPMFGICLGHQLLALSQGGETFKLKYGHRGGNQPATVTFGENCGHTFITTQNHGYAVRPESLEGKGEVSFVNANDRTCEGMIYPDKNAFSVQFHPEAHAGPHDTSFLFKQFIELMEEYKNA